MSSEISAHPHDPDPEGPSAPATWDGTTRRRFVGYLVAAPTLAVATQIGLEGFEPATAAAGPIPRTPVQTDVYDVGDLIRDSCRPTNHLLRLTVNDDGTAHFELPRAEVGQGITTAFAMLIAEELDTHPEKVTVVLSDARPELMYNQLTGGSSSLYSLHEPVMMLAALAKAQLVAAAARRWNVAPDTLTTRDGRVFGPDGHSAGYGALAVDAAAVDTRRTAVRRKAPSQYQVIGKPQGRLDARRAVTGAKRYAMDYRIPGALPTMICRGPHLRAKAEKLENEEQIRSMPGITDVGIVSTGVAVRGRTFGQCIDAIRAMRVTWSASPLQDFDNARVARDLKAAELPMPRPAPGAKVLDQTFTFNFRSGSPLETNCAVADVREDSTEVWSSIKIPIYLVRDIAQMVGQPDDKVTVHIVEGGGSFGRRLFADAALEAVECSKLFGKPVRLMWHRTDDSRHGRMHPMALSRVRVELVGDTVSAFAMRHTSVATDFGHGLGDMYSAAMARSSTLGNFSVSEGIFQLTAAAPYNFGTWDHLLGEIYDPDMFPTSSVRNVYSPDVATARELMVDRIAQTLGKDPVDFRLAYLCEGRMRDVLARCAEAGRWGREMPMGTAQGIAIHDEYKAFVATLVELDARPQTVRRRVPNAYTGPRVTKVVTVADPGLIINPLGFEAQMLGGAMDGVAQALSAGLHIDKGLPLEGSWDDYRYTRQWNVPFQFEFVPMPTGDVPGGAGELNCGVTMAAVACAYARAVGEMPTEFPINYRQPLGFTVKPRTPPIPQSPVNGRRFAR